MVESVVQLITIYLKIGSNLEKKTFLINYFYIIININNYLKHILFIIKFHFFLNAMNYWQK